MTQDHGEASHITYVTQNLFGRAVGGADRAAAHRFRRAEVPRVIRRGRPCGFRSDHALRVAADTAQREAPD